MQTQTSDDIPTTISSSSSSSSSSTASFSTHPQASDHSTTASLGDIPVCFVQESSISTTSSNSSKEEDEQSTAPRSASVASASSLSLPSQAISSVLNVSSSNVPTALPSEKAELIAALEPVLKEIGSWNSSRPHWAEISRNALGVLQKHGIENFWPLQAPVTTALCVARFLDMDPALDPNLTLHPFRWRYSLFFYVSHFQLEVGKIQTGKGGPLPLQWRSDAQVVEMCSKIYRFLTYSHHTRTQSRVFPPESFTEYPYYLSFFSGDDSIKVCKQRPCYHRSSINPYLSNDKLERPDTDALERLISVLKSDRLEWLIQQFGNDSYDPDDDDHFLLFFRLAECTKVVSNAIDCMISCVEEVDARWDEIASQKPTLLTTPGARHNDYYEVQPKQSSPTCSS